MESEVILSVFIGAAVFLLLVALLWRAQRSARTTESQTSQGSAGVVTTSVATTHTSAPLVLGHANGEEENPSEQTITDILTALHANGDDTITLDDPDHSGNYLQTFLERDGNFYVEFHEGSTARHYRATPNPDLASTRNLFFLFNRRDWETLKQTVTWEDTTNLY